MIFKKFAANWIPVFILGVLLIAVFRTFDNLGIILEWGARLLSLLVPFFIGGIIAYLLFPPCRKFEHLYQKSKLKLIRKGARGLSIITVYLMVITLIVALLRVVIPPIYESVEDFISHFPVIYTQFIAFMENLNLGNMEEFTQVFSMENVMQFLNLENIMGVTQGVLNFSLAILSLFIGVALSIYILIDRNSLYNIIHRIGHLYIKPKYLRPLVKYTRKINEFLYKYIFSQLLDSLIMGISSFIILSIINVRYALVSALLLGLFNFVPYFGSIIATVITVLLALLSDGPTAALVVGIFILFLQQIDANFIQPRLAGTYLNVRPFWVILGILIGGGYFGIWGMFLAPPIVAVIKIIVGDILVHKENRLKETGETNE